ncbi:PIN domain-containing protein [Pseudoclavibacter helvolus]|uniref:PIN domain-containing protein n=1 Tax=Pseudoclavibacter helvolus TaxID=255205 RepID=UPI003C725401
MARFAAYLDACTLVPVVLCDTLLRLAERGLYRPLWSDQVIAEAREALTRIHPDIDVNRINARFRSMNEAFDDALVSGWQPLVEGLTLPDPNDRHILAAALVGRADLIVTANVRDFPGTTLDAFGIAVVTPDEFLLDQLDLRPALVVEVLEEQAHATRDPSLTVDAVLTRLERAQAPQFASTLRAKLATDSAQPR